VGCSGVSRSMSGNGTLGLNCPLATMFASMRSSSHDVVLIGCFCGKSRGHGRKFGWVALGFSDPCEVMVL